MATFIYKAKKNAAQVFEGELESGSRQEAISKISAQGLFPVSVEEKTASSKIPAKCPLKELVAFTSQLSTLINSGSPLLKSLETLAFQTQASKLKPVIIEIIYQVKEGSDFSRSLQKYPLIFSRLYASLVKIGETSGTLGDNLKRIAEFLEEDMDFKANLKSVLTYPFLIMGVGVLTVFALLKFVIPKLVNIFQDLGQALPGPTQILVNVSDAFSKYWLVIIAAFGGVFFLLKKYFKGPEEKFKLDVFKLKLPVLGDLIQAVEITRLARTLSVLLKNGVPIDTSIRVLSETISNLHIQREVAAIEESIKGGATLSESVKKAKVFDAAFINVITVGEDSGQLEHVLENLANDYDKDVNRKIKALMSLMEPMLILGVGLVVGFVVLSMLLPIFQLDFNF